MGNIRLERMIERKMAHNIQMRRDKKRLIELRVIFWSCRKMIDCTWREVKGKISFISILKIHKITYPTDCKEKRLNLSEVRLSHHKKASHLKERIRKSMNWRNYPSQIKIAFIWTVEMVKTKRMKRRGKKNLGKWTERKMMKNRWT